MFRNAAGANAFTLAAKKWIESTNAVGIVSKSGRYGGTFAHKDIAFEFASWISAEFKLYIIKDCEFFRLGLSQKERLLRLNASAKQMMKSLLDNAGIERLKRFELPKK